MLALQSVWFIVELPLASRESNEMKSKLCDSVLIQLKWLDGDIVCLQEVDPPYFEDILEGEMLHLGYKGLFVQKARCTGLQEGVALFYKWDRFDLKEARKLVLSDIAAGILAQTECKEFGEAVILAALLHKNSGVVLVIGKTPFSLLNKTG